MTAVTNPLTYNGYVNQIATLAVVNTVSGSNPLVGVDAAFNAIIPQMLNYAELRIQRDLDLLPALNSLSYTLVANTNILQLGADDFVTIDTITAAVGTQNPALLPAAKEFIQNVYTSPASAGPPQYYAMVGGDFATGGTTYNNVLVGPQADQNYTLTVYGQSRLPSLNSFSGSSTTAGTNYTFISTYYPDMLLMASMVYISAFQRNFGRGSDDPAMAQSYEGQYQALKQMALTEENRKRFMASDWTSQPPSPAATPNRQG
jgi:hypothetical protein